MAMLKMLTVVTDATRDAVEQRSRDTVSEARPCDAVAVAVAV